jgi:hypothetical protein
LDLTPPDEIVAEVDYFHLNPPALADIEREVTPDEVNEASSYVKPNSSVVSNIPMKIFKLCFLAFLVPLAILFMDIFKSALIPDSLKVATVIPLYKGKGSFSICDNYRPISLLSPLSKIFEIVIFNKLRNFIEPKLCRQQHGFRRYHSTHSALTLFSQDIWNALDASKGRVFAVFIDQKKAFNSVQSDILLHKLIFKFLVPHWLVKVLKNFLSSRLFRIKLGNFYSKLFPDLNSVP